MDVKTVCLGSIVGSLDKVDPNGAFAYTATVRAAAEDEFRTSFITLLNSTADHDSVPKRIIEATARSRPDLALEVIAKLNYQSRRDEMLLYMVSCILDGPSQSTRYDVLCDLLGRWSDLRMEEDALDDIMAAVARSEDEEFLAKQWHHIQVLLDRGLKAEDPHLQSRILSCGLKIFHEARRVDSQLRELMLQRLVTAWTRIGDPGTKLRTAYVLAKRLSEYERETALEYLRRADSERSYYSALGEPTYISSLRLVIRAYSGLLPQERQRETDLDRITSLIDHVPAPLMRVRLWTDLALRVFRYERDDIGRKLVQSKLKPTLDFLKDGCTHEWKEAVEFAAPALYRLSAVYAIEYLAGLPFESSDLAFENILRFLVTRMPPGEPVKWTETDGFHLGYDTCVEILKLAERIEADHVVYKYASVVADSAVWKRNRFAPSQEQRNALSHQILELSQKKFPNPRCIAHEGFAIIAEGQATRLLRERHANWQPLIQRARALDNVSDRAFVLMMLGEMLHAGHIQQRGQLYEEARVAIDQIPAAIDRVERLTLLADVLRDQDPSRAKGVLKIAAEALKGQQNDGREELCRSVVDSAYQIDPDFAASLTSLLDNDSGRRVAQRRIEYQKLRTKWRDDKSEADLHEHEDIDALEDVARDLLESLNGERVAARSIESCISLLKRLQGASLHRCFWTFSWTLQNLIQKRSYSEEARSLLREVFEAVLSASEIGRVLITRAAGQSVAAGRTPERNSSSVLIKAGERSKAIDYIGHWLTTVASDFVYICDPYFGAGELEALRLILETNPTLKVKVITSRRKQENDGANNLGSLEQAYERQWRHLCEQSPPECEIIAIGNASGDLPIHDRWWLSRAGGMRTGTSFNQLGRAKDSEVSVLSGEEFAERLQEIEAYIRRERREHMGQRLSYQAFWL